MSDEIGKSRWQAEFDALPEWAKQLVLIAQRSGGYGIASGEMLGARCRSVGTIFLADGDGPAWGDAVSAMSALGDALTAPYPPPPPPAREKRAVNTVEIIAGDEEGGGFDQPCAFGNRVPGHAVYCHNDAWPNSPRKCRRGRDDPHADCPGYVVNPDFVPEPSLRIDADGAVG